MRLVNTRSLKFEEFDEPPGRYAILSHTWDHGKELSYQQMKEGSTIDENGVGWQKLYHTCRIAKAQDIPYAWIDTCCINKADIPELTESINSMFKWYQKAYVCYAYISDWEPGAGVAAFCDCKWFTRGWCLQELVAPYSVQFFDRGWNYCGDKSSLKHHIAKITRIDLDVLGESRLIHYKTVAQRMSWAAQRETSKVEDLAYCLLGIFNVSMPMLYGEGERAFMRLQEEIIKETNDLTVFAWKAGPGSPPYSGILAKSARDFASAGRMVQAVAGEEDEEFSMTNKGIKLNELLLLDSDSHDYILRLRCFDLADSRILGIYLRKVGANRFVRSRPQDLALAESKGESAIIYVAKYIPIVGDYVTEYVDSRRESAIHFRTPLDTPDFHLHQIHPRSLWDAPCRLFLTQGSPVFFGYVYFQPEWHDEFDSFVIACGTESVEGDLRGWCCVFQGEYFNKLKDKAEIGRTRSERSKSHAKTLRNRRGKDVAKHVSATIQKDLAYGKFVWCIDLQVTEREHIQ